MNKRLIIAIVVMALMMIFSGCGVNTRDDDKINIVCTQFSQYDWVKNIVGDVKGVEITLLVKNGVDMHSYQPSADDMITIKQADVFIYVGGESDSWIKDALKQANSDMVKINMMDILLNSDKSKELIAQENIDDENHEEHIVQAIDNHEEHDHEFDNDEHIWLSLENAKILCNEIKNKLCTMDSKNEQVYNDNCEQYINKIDDLINKYNKNIKSKNIKIVLADRYPFAYLFRDNNIECFAAFNGCAAETEASFETVIKLADNLDKYNMKYIYISDETKRDFAKTIISNSKDDNREILFIESLQSVTQKKLDEGLTYIGAMEDNLNKLMKSAE